MVTLSANEFQLSAQSDETALRYEKDFERFRVWCEANGYQECEGGGFSAKATAEFLAYLASLCKTSTVKRYAAEISAIHNENRWPNPCEDRDVKRTLKGINKVLGNDRVAKRPLTYSDIKAMVDEIDTDCYQGKFHRALVLFGWASCMRRSEVVRVMRDNVGGVTDDQGNLTGLQVIVPKSKTGAFVRLVHVGEEKIYCPVNAMLSLLKAQSDIESTMDAKYVFCSRQKRAEHISDSTYPNVLKQYALKAGIVDKKTVGEIGGHSTRRGCINHLAMNNHSVIQIMNLSGHKSPRVMMDYIDQALLASETPAAAKEKQ